MPPIPLFLSACPSTEYQAKKPEVQIAMLTAAATTPPLFSACGVGPLCEREARTPRKTKKRRECILILSKNRLVHMMRITTTGMPVCREYCREKCSAKLPKSRGYLYKMSICEALTPYLYKMSICDYSCGIFS
jgi:hypothetical protein